MLQVFNPWSFYKIHLGGCIEYCNGATGEEWQQGCFLLAWSLFEHKDRIAEERAIIRIRENPFNMFHLY